MPGSKCGAVIDLVFVLSRGDFRLADIVRFGMHATLDRTRDRSPIPASASVVQTGA